MNIARVDTVATSGTSLLHRASPAVKLVGFALLLAAVIASPDALQAASLALVALAVGFAMQLPLGTLAALAAYPAMFAVIFSVAAAPTLISAALIVSRAVAAALCALLLLFTTPYPQIFAPVQRFLPAVVSDSLLMTYRSLFLLLEKFSHVLTAARLRAGLVGRDPLRSARMVTHSLGSVVLYSFDLSQRTYDVMHLRGYSSRLVVSTARHGSRSDDIAVLAFALVVSAASLAARLVPSLSEPFAWFALFLTVAVAASSTALRTIRRRDRM